jgi:hypothetical protein
VTAWTGQRVKRSWSVRERLDFWSEVTATGCREWRGSDDGREGYGKITIANRSYYAHRVSWENASGEVIPPGMVLRHTCDNPPCIEPTHLVVGTQAENVGDQIARHRMVRMRGASHALSKLTAEQAGEIRDRFNRGGTTKAQLAREYGLSATGVWRVITGRSYSKEQAA